MFKVQAILRDGSVRLEFMTDDANEAEEMRTEWLAFDCMAGVRIEEAPGWIPV